MQAFKVKAWTGPAAVKEISQGCRDAGLSVTCEGTEHVYLTSEGNDVSGACWNVLASLMKAHGKDYGLKVVPC